MRYDTQMRSIFGGYEPTMYDDSDPPVCEKCEYMHHSGTQCDAMLLTVINAHKNDIERKNQLCTSCGHRHGSWISCAKWRVCQFNIDKYSDELRRIAHAMEVTFSDAIIEAARRAEAMQRLDRVLARMR